MWAEALPLLARGAALATALMLVAWLLHLRMKNAGIVDVFWSLTLGSLALLDAALGSGDETRRLLVAAMGGLWGLRLTLHLAHRVAREPEDGRYQTLRARWGGNVEAKFLAFFLAQGLSCVALSTPFLVASVNAAPSLSPLEAAGVALFALAIGGESLADAQLRRFKADPANRGKTCRAGLWRYSRHPNYFFEWLVWCAWALFALASPWGALALLCPAAMLYLLFRVTGIPATEEQALKSRGDDYRDYQRTTSAFFPWFPKAEGTARGR